MSSLSGGQQQRVAIARALVNRPKVLLLDEPLGALDMRLRKDMQNELKRIQQAMGITFIYVTHDQEEALSMSDTVVVMDKGQIQQIGTPEDIYNEPQNAFAVSYTHLDVYKRQALSRRGGLDLSKQPASTSPRRGSSSRSSSALLMPPPRQMISGWRMFTRLIRPMDSPSRDVYKRQEQRHLVHNGGPGIRLPVPLPG